MKITTYQNINNKSLKNLWKLVFNKSEKQSDYLINWLIGKDSGILLIAIDGSGTVIGSRASWNWEFSSYQKSYKCSQFGLTSVHPEYRRKGIFSRLNQECLKLLKLNNTDFVFNVSLPNAMLGYQKMGWEYEFNIQRLMRISFNFMFSKRNKSFKISKELDIKLLFELFNKKNEINKKYLTSIQNINRLKSRFENKINYNVYQSEDIVILYKITKEKKMKSIFIGDIFSKLSDYNNLNYHINSIQHSERALFVSTYISKNHPLNEIYKNNNFKILKKKSPLGIKLINNNISISKLHDNLIISYLDLDTF